MVGDDGGRRRASNALNMSEGQATRRMTKSLECVKHERGGTRQGNQPGLYEMAIEAEASHALNTSEGEGGCGVRGYDYVN